MADTGAKFNTPEGDRDKAKVFFERGRTVAGTGNYEYAIDMYISGLAYDPESKDAHQALREIALKRKAGGKKPLGMLEAMKLRGGKEDKQKMLNAEKLLAYDPGNTEHMVNLLLAAHKAGYGETVMWLGPILRRANNEAKKEDYNKYIILKDVYKDLGEWQLAIESCHLAAKARPDDMDLQHELRQMSANEAMKRGKYEKSFTTSMANAGQQQDLIDAGKDVQGDDYVRKQIALAEQEYKASPNEPGKVMKYVDALRKTETMDNENRAIEVLEDAYQRTKAYRFKQQIGEISIRQFNRMVRAKKTELDADPKNETLQKEFQQLRNDQYEHELKEFLERAENYPTEMDHRYEAGKRLFGLRRFDESIPLFQQATNDPKRKNSASLFLGRAFFEAGFFDECIEILGQLINEYPLKGDDNSKEMYYWRGRAYEQKGEKPEAIKHYSQVAQWNFGYRDVQARIKKLRAQSA